MTNGIGYNLSSINGNYFYDNNSYNLDARLSVLSSIVWKSDSVEAMLLMGTTTDPFYPLKVSTYRTPKTFYLTAKF